MVPSMTGLKTVCVVALMYMVVVSAPMAEATITCGQDSSAFAPCINYLTRDGAMSARCCNGVRSLNAAAKTVTAPLDRIKLLFLFILFNFLSFATITNAQAPTFLSQSCSTNRTTANSAFHLDLRTLFSSLSSNATANKEFYNTTVTGRTPSDAAYGLFMCRSDVSSQQCRQCVLNATQKLSTDQNCSLSKQAVIWYDGCMVRYSNHSFSSTVATRPGVFLSNTTNISNQASFKHLLFDTMNETADEAANFPVGVKKNATK